MTHHERHFEKHRVLADIYAVEWLVDPDFAREAVGALRCTKPEQLTRGALAVLPLVNGEDIDFYRTNCREFDRWEPPMADEEKLDAIIAAESVCEQAEAAHETAKKAAAAAKHTYEKACDDLRRVVRLAKAEAVELPLLAIAEAPADPPFDADMETFNDDRDADAGADQHPE